MSSAVVNANGWQIISADAPAWELFIPVAPWWENGHYALLAEIFMRAPGAESVNTSLWRLDRACRFVAAKLWNDATPMFAPAIVSYCYNHFHSLSKEQKNVESERKAGKLLDSVFG